MSTNSNKRKRAVVVIDDDDNGSSKSVARNKRAKRRICELASSVYNNYLEINGVLFDLHLERFARKTVPHHT